VAGSVLTRAEDRELPGQLEPFTESVTKTGSNLDELKTQHTAAIKVVEAENRKKMDDKKKANGSKPASSPPGIPTATVEFKDGKPVYGSKAPQPPVESRSLFDNPASEEDATTGDAAGETPTTSQPQHPNASATS
jgi:hypothetical protein